MIEPPAASPQMLHGRAKSPHSRYRHGVHVRNLDPRPFGRKPRAVSPSAGAFVQFNAPRLARPRRVPQVPLINPAASSR
jgi:hypothetical protein